MKLREMFLNETVEDSSKGGSFNNWFGALIDYVNMNLGRDMRFMTTPSFKKEAVQAFKKGTDPYTFISEFLADHAEYSFGGMREDLDEAGSGFFGGEDPHPVKPGSGTTKRSKRSSWLGRSPQRIPTDPEGGSFGDCPTCHGYGNIMTGAQGQSAECPECGGSGGNVQDGFSDWEQRNSEDRLQPRDDDEGFYDPSDDAAEAEWKYGMEEAHGERAASRSRFKRSDAEKARHDKFKSSKMGSAADFGGPDPDDEMFFGGEEPEDFDDTDDGGDIEDPTSSRNPEPEVGFGPIDEPEVDPEHPAWPGSVEVDPSDVPGRWNERGIPVDADVEDIDLDAGYGEDEPTHRSSQWSHYWDDRERAKRSSSRLDPIRRSHGEKVPAGLAPRRKPR